MKAWTEGPYGHEKYRGEDYDTLLLVAGGSGVSYALSNAMDIVRRARAMHRGSESGSMAISTKRLSLVWKVKQPEQVAWIDGHLKGMCLLAPPHLLHITIFITGKRKADEVEVMAGLVTDDKRKPVEEDGDAGLSQAVINRQESIRTKRVDHEAIVELRSGRPDFGEIVAREVAATDYAGWLAMWCCGPTPMNASLADAVSKAVQPKAILRGEVRRNIYLTIEEFGW